MWQVVEKLDSGDTTEIVGRSDDDSDVENDSESENQAVGPPSVSRLSAIIFVL